MKSPKLHPNRTIPSYIFFSFAFGSQPLQPEQKRRVDTIAIGDDHKNFDTIVVGDGDYAVLG